ncbi:MAG: hypothetical protein JJD92_13550 [Frankiaceae bacterium]|nr:hypothetical protein [Frankiaceae bacterium]
MHRNPTPRGRLHAAVRSATLSGVLALGLVFSSGLPTLPALTATAADGDALHLVGFVDNSALSYRDGTHPKVDDDIGLVGMDTSRGEAVAFNRTTRTLFRLSASTLTQTGPAIATAFPPATDQGGKYGAAIVDPALHRTYIGRALRNMSLCNTPQLTCAAPSPVAVPASIAGFDLTTGASAVVELPHEFDGFEVIGLTAVTTPAGRHLLVGLLNLNAATVVDPANVRGLQLVALDADRMLTEPTDAFLWSYAVPQCMSTPTWSVRSEADFLGVDPQGRFAYFACRGSADTTSLATKQPPGALVVNFPTAFPTDPATDGFRTTLYPFGAKVTFAISGGDSSRGLLYLASVGAQNKVYVFDTEHRAWTGSVPFAPGDYGGSLAAVVTDASSGEAYGIYPQGYAVSFPATSLPVAQGTRPAYGDIHPPDAGTTVGMDPTTHRLLIARPDGAFQHLDGSTYPGDHRIAVFQDNRPHPAQAEPADPDEKTHDIEVTERTPVAYRGFASGYGTRASVIGGYHSTSAYSVEVGGEPGLAGVATAGCNLSQRNICLAVPSMTDGDRTVTIAQVTNTELSDSAARSDAAPIAIDTNTENDSRALESYNPGDLVQRPEGLQPPPPSPAPDEVTAAREQATAPAQEQQAPAQCLDFGGKPAQTATPGAAAQCDAAGQKAQGSAATPNVFTDSPLQVGYSGVSIEASRQEGQSVTRAVAAARGISITIPGGLTVDIGEVLTTATTIAGGRPGTAMSTFERTISAVTVKDAGGDVLFACGFRAATPEGGVDACDPRQLTEVVSEHAWFPVLFLTPEPDQSSRVAGSPGGAQAEVIKSPYQRVNDYITNGDSGVEVAGLQVIVVADHRQPSRLVMQFAGLHAESHYEIGTTPPAPAVLPDPSLLLKLLDDATPPAGLSGATFAVQGPNGTAPLSCLTAADGIGTCRFDKLPPGSYTIREVSAPPGFAPVEDYDVILEADNDYEISFVNLPAIGSVELTLSSPDVGDKPGGPLEGGVFALVKGDALLDQPLATCTTDTEGACGLDDVPLGDYTMQQVTAPDGFVPSKAVEFSLTKPREVARLAFVDGIPGVEAVPPVVIPGKPAVPPKVIPGKPAVPPKVIPGKPAVPPRTMVLPALAGTGQAGLAMDPVGYETDANAPVVASSPSDAMAPLQLGAGGLAAVPARLARLLVHSPQQAVLLLFMWLVLGMPVYLWVRRRQFLTATEGI